MIQIYSGNIESLSYLVERINNGQKFRFLPTNEITFAKLRNDRLQFSGIFCKGIGKLFEQNDKLTIDFKVRLRRQFPIIGLLTLILISKVIWGDNVTINGDHDPSIWKRIALFSIGLAFFSIPAFILRKLRNDFEERIIETIKKSETVQTY